MDSSDSDAELQLFYSLSECIDTNDSLLMVHYASQQRHISDLTASSYSVLGTSFSITLGLTLVSRTDVIDHRLLGSSLIVIAAFEAFSLNSSSFKEPLSAQLLTNNSLVGLFWSCAPSIVNYLVPLFVSICSSDFVGRIQFSSFFCSDSLCDIPLQARINFWFFQTSVSPYFLVDSWAQFGFHVLCLLFSRCLQDQRFVTVILWIADTHHLALGVCFLRVAFSCFWKWSRAYEIIFTSLHFHRLLLSMCNNGTRSAAVSVQPFVATGTFAVVQHQQLGISRCVADMPMLGVSFFPSWWTDWYFRSAGTTSFCSCLWDICDETEFYLSKWCHQSQVLLAL